MSRILLADDSPHAQRMGERILREEGYEVATVTDGNTALLRLSDVDPDVVFADVSLPGHSGYDICRRIKTTPRHKHVRVILTAGLLEPFDEEQAKEAGCDGVLKKPFESSVVLDTVKPLIKAATADKEQRPPTDPVSAKGTADTPAPRPAQRPQEKELPPTIKMTPVAAIPPVAAAPVREPIAAAARPEIPSKPADPPIKQFPTPSAPTPVLVDKLRSEARNPDAPRAEVTTMKLQPAMLESARSEIASTVANRFRTEEELKAASAPAASAPEPPPVSIAPLPGVPFEPITRAVPVRILTDPVPPAAAPDPAASGLPAPDPERVRAAVTLALDAAMPALIDKITEQVLIALSQ